MGAKRWCGKTGALVQGAWFIHCGRLVSTVYRNVRMVAGPKNPAVSTQSSTILQHKSLRH